MITNIHRAKTAGDVQRYVRYTLAPKEEKKNKYYQAGERVLDIDADYIDIGAKIEHNTTSHAITNQIIDWNKEHRPGKKAPACPALLGEISFTKADAEKFYTTSHTGQRYLDTAKVLAVCKQAVGMTMGDDRPMFLSLHGDTECLHVHFAAAMVDSKGKVWDGSTLVDEHGNKTKVRDYRQWELTNEKLEIEHGLDRVQHRKAVEHEGEHRQAQVKRPSNAVVHLANKGQLAPSLDLASRLELAHNQSNKQFDKFLELAEANGIRIKPNMSETKVNGLSFAIDGMDGFIKASDLGNKYKWAKLSKELNYEHQRDYPKLAELKTTARPDVATPGANQRIATIADAIITAAELTERLADDTGIYRRELQEELGSYRSIEHDIDRESDDGSKRNVREVKSPSVELNDQADNATDGTNQEVQHGEAEHQLDSASSWGIDGDSSYSEPIHDLPPGQHSTNQPLRTNDNTETTVKPEQALKIYVADLDDNEMFDKALYIAGIEEPELTIRYGLLNNLRNANIPPWINPNLADVHLHRINVMDFDCNSDFVGLTEAMKNNQDRTNYQPDGENLADRLGEKANDFFSGKSHIPTNDYENIR